jgi:hypothetical protein
VWGNSLRKRLGVEVFGLRSKFQTTLVRAWPKRPLFPVTILQTHQKSLHPAANSMWNDISREHVWKPTSEEIWAVGYGTEPQPTFSFIDYLCNTMRHGNDCNTEQFVNSRIEEWIPNRPKNTSPMNQSFDIHRHGSRVLINFLHAGGPPSGFAPTSVSTHMHRRRSVTVPKTLLSTLNCSLNELNPPSNFPSSHAGKSHQHQHEITQELSRTVNNSRRRSTFRSIEVS